MEKFNSRSLSPNLVKPLSVIFGLEEAIVSWDLTALISFGTIKLRFSFHEQLMGTIITFVN